MKSNRLILVAHLIWMLGVPVWAADQAEPAKPTFDQEIVDFLSAEQFLFFDMNKVQVLDFQRYRVSWDDYLKQYFIGHYNPRGNHFFAYSIKQLVIEWLDPKPITYRNPDPASVDFRGYLPDTR